MGAFLDDIQPRPFQMQTQRLVGVFLQVFAHDADALLHQIIAGSNQRRQEVGAAGTLIRFLHNFQRFDGDRIRTIVELHAAAAVQLDVDETGGNNRAVDRALLNFRRQISQRTETFDTAIGDNNRMVIENFMTGVNPALG